MTYGEKAGLVIMLFSTTVILFLHNQMWFIGFLFGAGLFMAAGDK